MQKVKKLINPKDFLIPDYWKQHNKRKQWGNVDDDHKIKLKQHIAENELYNSCLYCEKKFSRIDIKSGKFTNIEHLYPRASFRDKECDFYNLSVTCTSCNSNRGDYFENIFIEVLKYPENYIKLNKITLKFEALSEENKSEIKKIIDILKLNENEKVDFRRAKHKEIKEHLKANPSVSKTDLITKFGFPSLIEIICE